MEKLNPGKIKTPKYCDGCGKPLFKFWANKISETCINVKVDVSCKREACIQNGTANKTVDLKVDLADLVAFPTRVEGTN